MTATMAGGMAVIGFGVMGESLVRNTVNRGLAPPGAITVSDINPSRVMQAEQLGVRVSSGNRAAVEGAGLVLLCVKPQSMSDVIQEIAGSLMENQVVVSIAAGVTTRSIEDMIGGPVPVVRAMPNIPLVVNEGVIAVAAGRFADQASVESARYLFESSGRVFMVDESMMDAVTGFSGSGPAFVAVVIEALSDAGVRVGFSRAQALTMAAQTVLGSAKVVLDTGLHPAILKDRVASPGGTAIAGLHQLEQSAVRAGVMSAVAAATVRSAEMGRFTQALHEDPGGPSHKRCNGPEDRDAAIEEPRRYVSRGTEGD